MDKFKIGDIVEGEEGNRLVIGRVAHIMEPTRLGVDIFEQRILGEVAGGELHDLDGNIARKNGWYIPARTAKHAKNYVVKQIIDDL